MFFLHLFQLSLSGQVQVHSLYCIKHGMSPLRHLFVWNKKESNYFDEHNNSRTIKEIKTSFCYWPSKSPQMSYLNFLRKNSKRFLKSTGPVRFILKSLKSAIWENRFNWKIVIGKKGHSNCRSEIEFLRKKSTIFTLYSWFWALKYKYIKV